MPFFSVDRPTLGFIQPSPPFSSLRLLVLSRLFFIPHLRAFYRRFVFHVLKANGKPQMLPRTPFRCVRKIKKHNGLLIKCLLTELGLAKQKNIWLLIRTHGPRFTRSVGADLEPNIFLSGPPTQP